MTQLVAKYGPEPDENEELDHPVDSYQRVQWTLLRLSLFMKQRAAARALAEADKRCRARAAAAAEAAFTTSVRSAWRARLREWYWNYAPDCLHDPMFLHSLVARSWNQNSTLAYFSLLNLVPFLKVPCLP